LTVRPSALAIFPPFARIISAHRASASSSTSPPPPPVPQPPRAPASPLLPRYPRPNSACTTTSPHTRGLARGERHANRQPCGMWPLERERHPAQTQHAVRGVEDENVLYATRSRVKHGWWASVVHCGYERDRKRRRRRASPPCWGCCGGCGNVHPHKRMHLRRPLPILPCCNRTHAHAHASPSASLTRALR
jgi:hypothetical protein